MRVAGLTKDGDWRFGKGRAVYLSDSDAVQQRVITRLKCFVNDWFLDMEYGGDWINIFQSSDAENRLIREVERIILDTEGIRAIENIEIVQIEDRSAKIRVDVIDVYDAQFSTTTEVI